MYTPSGIAVRRTPTVKFIKPSVEICDNTTAYQIMPNQIGYQFKYPLTVSTPASGSSSIKP